MKNIVNKLILLILFVPFVSACTEDALENKDVTQLEIIATINEPGTRANMSIRENSLDVITRWSGSDHLKVFCSKTGEEYLEESKDVGISEVIDEGRSAKFVFEPLKSWKNDNGEIDDDSKFAYITNRCFPVYDKDAQKLFINASLLRNPLENFLAPVYSLSEYSEYSLIQARFQHYYTYELLHILNNTGKTIHFRFNGFEGTHWFKDRGSICLDDGEFYQESVATRGRSEEFAEMDIEPNETGILMSAYIPNGQKVDNAVLWANIDNNDVSTTNTLSSDVELQTGHAYHMYATWDGTELKFGKDDQEHGSADSNEYVDLGLPSGTLWATHNIGAHSPEDFGDYFAWGETSLKNEYNWSTYKWCNGSQNTITKYCTNGSYGPIDGMTVLEKEDDAAYVNWGEEWRMPTWEEQNELREHCDWEWTSINNVYGMRVKSKTNGNSIFLPAAGYRANSGLVNGGDTGYYQSATLDYTNSDDSYYFYINANGHFWKDFSTTVGRDVGFSVRPVYTIKNDGMIDNGDFSDGNMDFESDYVYVSETGAGALYDEGKFAIGTSPSNYHTDFIHHGDHTTGNGNMLIVNGSTDNKKYVWKKRFAVKKGITYEFSAWFMSVSTNSPLDKAMIEYNINGVANQGQYDKSENGWERYFWRYTASETGNIEVKIRTMSSDAGGNDFAIDDIHFSSLITFN